MKIQAVIFDLDGTLVDSMWMWKDIDIEYLGRYQIPLSESFSGKLSGRLKEKVLPRRLCILKSTSSFQRRWKKSKRTGT